MELNQIVKCPPGHCSWTIVILVVYDITIGTDSELRLFADDCVCYHEIKNSEDTAKLQADIDFLGYWARSWSIRFQLFKCTIMQITRKWIKKITASYTLKETVLDNVGKIKYLGITITNDMKWNTHVSNICTKANRTLGFLRRNLTASPQDVKESAYKGLVRPVLEYGSSVWKKRRQDSRLIMFYKGLKGANGNKVYKWMTLFSQS